MYPPSVSEFLVWIESYLSLRPPWLEPKCHELLCQTTRRHISEDLNVEEFIGAVIGGTPHTLCFLLQKKGECCEGQSLASPKGQHQAFELPALSWGVPSPLCCRITRASLMVHLYIVINTTIFLIVRLLLLRYNYMFRPSMLAVFRLYMKYLTISYIYLWVGSLQFVGWGGFEISFCVCRHRVCLGGFVKISFMSTNSYVYK
jgi:hypothetical protein